MPAGSFSSRENFFPLELLYEKDEVIGKVEALRQRRAEKLKPALFIDRGEEIIFSGLMKWNELFALRISELVLNQLKTDTSIILKEKEEVLRKRISLLVSSDFEREKQLDKEAQDMMDDLEKQGHQFERYKMFPLLKRQLAKKKGIIL